jgi:hypothetical protein
LRRARLRLGVALALVVGAPALAFVPPAERILDAIAETNRRDQRTAALAVPVEVRLAGSETPLRGELATHPSGFARLELVHADGTRERHLLRGARHGASRGGSVLDGAEPLVPPLFLLQAGTRGALATALLGLGVEVELAELGHEGRHDCFVIGGREIPPPPPGLAGARALLWADLETFEVVRVDDRSGLRFRFGPPASSGARLPAWVEVQRGEELRAWLGLGEAVASGLSVADFDWSWLTRP